MRICDALEAIKKLLAARIFVPFRVHITDGSSLDVKHPSHCKPLARTVLIGVAASGAIEAAALRTITVALIHITKLEPLDFTSAPSGNGVAHP